MSFSTSFLIGLNICFGFMSTFVADSRITNALGCLNFGLAAFLFCLEIPV